MFDNPKKELEKLEEQLLADEEWFKKELDSAKRMIGQNPNKPARPTAPRTPQAPKPAAKSAPQRNQQPAKQKKQPEPKAPAPKKKGIKGPLMVLAAEILGILGLVAYWVLFLL